MKKSIPRDHWPADAAHVLDAYRMDQRGELLATWGMSLLLIYGGSALASLGWLLDTPEENLRRILCGIGMVSVLFGLRATVLGLLRALERECYVSLREDGLVVRTEDSPWLVRWDDLVEVRSSESEPAIQLELRDGTTYMLSERYFGVTTAELARRIRTTRIRVIWGLPVRRERFRHAD